MKEKNKIFDELANSLISAKQQNSSSELRYADIVEQAYNTLSQKKLKEWLKDSRVNLKGTQAKKLVAVSKFCKNNGQSTDLFCKEGIEKTYIISRLKDQKQQSNYIKYLLINNLSSKQLKQSIKLTTSENISISESLNKLKENKPSTQRKSQVKELKEVINQLLEENKKLKSLLENNSIQSSENQQKQQSIKSQEIEKNQVTIFDALGEECLIA